MPISMLCYERKYYGIHMQTALHIKNSIFIIYLLEDKQELSLGMLIRLNVSIIFDYSMLFCRHSWVFLYMFKSYLYHFWELTY
jgi:hypothetical protein